MNSRTTGLLSWILRASMAILGLVPTVALAAFVSADFRTPGDAAITVDTQSGLEWLDLSYTDGVAFKAIEAGWDGLTTTDGFALPTGTQVEELLAHFGIQQSSDFIPSNHLPALAFQSFLGTTGSGNAASGYYARGPLHQTAFGRLYTLHSFFVWASETGGAAGPMLVACVFRDCYSEGAADYGTFLVRPARAHEVPEPSTLVLTLSACAVALAGRRFRRRGCLG